MMVQQTNKQLVLIFFLREGNVVIEEGSEVNTAKNTSYWKALSGDQVLSMGKHIDLLHKCEDGEWKFFSRKVIFVWTKDSGHITDVL